jgi:hypothetical protein
MEMRNANRLLGRSRRRLVGNIKMDPREIGWGGLDWIDLAQHRDRLRDPVNMVMNHQVPQTAQKLLSSCTTSIISRRTKLH